MIHTMNLILLGLTSLTSPNQGISKDIVVGKKELMMNLMVIKGKSKKRVMKFQVPLFQTSDNLVFM